MTDQNTWRALNEEDPDFRIATLKARAKALAVEPVVGREASEILEIVEFRIAGETFGVERAFVREVFALLDFTPLPGVPEFILGIANVRGQVISIVDLKKMFPFPAEGLGEFNKVIVLQSDHMEFGLLADAVLGVRGTARSEIQPAPSAVKGIGGEYLLGVTAEPIIVLNAGKLLSDPGMVIHQTGE